MNDINSELILRFQPRWKTDIEVMVGKTNTKAKYSTCVGTRYENGLVNNFETHGASYTEVSKRFDCGFIRPRNFMIFSVIIICISHRTNLESYTIRFVVFVHLKSANSSQAMITNFRDKNCRKSRKNHPLIF